MLECEGQGGTTEWEYVQALPDRDLDDCLGALLSVTLPAPLVMVIEHGLFDQIAFERLWAGHRPDRPEHTFELCVGHWMDLSYLTGSHGHWYGRSLWVEAATELFQDVCRAARWDPKEVVNLLTWQRVLLT